MSYMIEGGGSNTLSRAKSWLYRHKDASHQLLQAITNVSIDYLQEQVRAGAQALQVNFDVIFQKEMSQYKCSNRSIARSSYRIQCIFSLKMNYVVGTGV